jgi:hypothetical protein
MSTWLINDQSPEYYGLRVVGGTFRSGRASSVQLSRAVAFEASESFAHGASVVIKRDGSPFFRGKVRAIDKGGSATDEGQDYLVEDVWAELELLTYQEPWLIRQSDYTGIAYSPTVILGMNSAGTRINVGQQISEVLTFAIARGLSLTAGTMPTGMMLWPSEVNGMSCAEVIRDCLRYYPDWVPWIDHSTSPPTFNVTPRATATTHSLAVTQCTNFRCTKTQDRIPAGVRIVYLTASKIDDEVYRSMSIDQYPTVSGAELVAAAGPGILVTTVELAGMTMQIQKQQVQTRTLPTSSAGAKDYLRLKFPAIKDLADTDFNITEWTTAVIPEDDDEVDPIDVKLERIPGSDRSDLPRELVKGAIAEWMQKKVGRVLIEFKVEATGTATEEETAKLAKLPPSLTVTATNAVSKIYKGISSYTAGEDAPSGVAQAFYTTLVNGCYFEGSATLRDVEIATDNYHGGVLNLTGGVSEWSTMKAPIHAVSWDLSTCETVLDFGPNPEFSFQDFMEFLKLLNKRPNNEYTVNERAGEFLGDDAGISARGDSVGAYDVPETIVSGGGTGGGETFSHPFKITTSTVDDVAKYTVAKGAITDGTNGTAISLTGIIETTTTATAGYVVLEADVDELLVITGWALAIKSTAAEANEVGMTTTGEIRQNKIRLLIGKLTLDGAVATAWQAQFASVRIGRGILNGVEVKVFEHAPTHATKI